MFMEAHLREPGHFDGGIGLDRKEMGAAEREGRKDEIEV